MVLEVSVGDNHTNREERMTKSRSPPQRGKICSNHHKNYSADLTQRHRKKCGSPRLSGLLGHSQGGLSGKTTSGSQALRNPNPSGLVWSAGPWFAGRVR